MGYRKLIAPEFKVGLKQYEITSGMEVEFFSSREAKSDWCRVELTTQLQNVISYDDMDEATVELGYEDDYDLLLCGYVRKIEKDYWKEIMIRDDMIKLERTVIKNSFEKCNPQDIIKYILTQAGIKDYELTEEEYGSKDVFVVNRQNAIKAIMEVNAIWGIDNDFFFKNKKFYWGVVPVQNDIYVLEESENILSLQKYGELWECETLGIPWIHQSEQVEISHSKYTGIVKVEKVIIKSDSKGQTRMYLYFKGG